VPGSTPELNLKTAVDADDTADYLTLSLADSLRTVDALYNNVTGHTHSGIHQGGPIASVPASALADGSITSVKIADGAIVTLDLADGAVTTPKIAANAATQRVYAIFGTAISVTNSGNVDSGDSITITTQAGSDLLVMARFPVVMSATSSAVVGGSLLLDGAGYTMWNQVVQANEVSRPLIMSGWMYAVGVPAATHTIKTQWTCNAGTMTQWTDSRSLLAVEIKR
jgi:hypothetical protein